MLELFEIDIKSKKRKADAPASKTVPPSKKTATTVASSSKVQVIKKEVKPALKDVKDAKSDSSFFSAPKPKPKLPSFKKAPTPTVQKEPEQNIAQPSTFDPFQEALKSMAKVRKDSHPPMTLTLASTPPPVTNVTGSSTTSVSLKTGKKRKSVTWAPESQLVAIRLIERAIYDDDPADVSIFLLCSARYNMLTFMYIFFYCTQGVHTTHNIRDLDRDEGAALHAHLFEEQIDWFEPQCEQIYMTLRGRKKILTYFCQISSVGPTGGNRGSRTRE